MFSYALSLISVQPWKLLADGVLDCAAGAALKPCSDRLAKEVNGVCLFAELCWWRLSSDALIFGGCRNQWNGLRVFSEAPLSERAVKKDVVSGVHAAWSPTGWMNPPQPIPSIPSYSWVWNIFKSLLTQFIAGHFKHLVSWLYPDKSHFFFFKLYLASSWLLAGFCVLQKDASSSTCEASASVSGSKGENTTPTYKTTSAFTLDVLLYNFKQMCLLPNHGWGEIKLYCHCHSKE